MTLSKEAISRAERIRSLCEKRAYELECATGTAPLSFKAPKDVTELVNSFSEIRGSEAVHAAGEITASNDPLAFASRLMPNINDSVLNFLLSQCSYRYFCSKYFPHIFTRKWSRDYHDVYFSMIRDVETHRTYNPTIVAGPPEWGKSTIGSVILPLHAIIFDNIVYLANGKELDLSKHYIALIGVVEKNVKRYLDTIKGELEHNDAIRRDFGEFYRIPGSKSRNEPWSETVAVTLNERRVEVFGRKGKIRGALWKAWRPSLIVGDDLENDENKNSIICQNRDYEWLKMVIHRTPKENGNVMILGNLVNPNGLLDRYVKEGTAKGWNVKVFRLYEKDEVTGEKKYTWPEEFGEEYEKAKRAQTGNEHFEAEFLSNPEAYFREVNYSSIRYYTVDQEFLDRLPKMHVFAAADPAASVNERSDFTAVVGLAEDPATGLMYMLPSVNERVPIGKQADVILDYQLQWNPIVFGVESVAYQNALVDRLEDLRRERRHMYFSCVPITHPYLTRKKERIAQRLFKRVADGAILFPADDKVAATCIDQLVNLKTTLHDDLCFVEGTLITTDNGDVPVEKIEKGDKVLTRQGYKEVIEAESTGLRDLQRVEFVDGTVLEGTPEHPIWNGDTWEELANIKEGFRLRRIRPANSHRVNTPLAELEPLVPVPVVSSRKNGTARVYNIKVAGANEYFANGILVHNCDALEMAVRLRDRELGTQVAYKVLTANPEKVQAIPEKPVELPKEENERLERGRFTPVGPDHPDYVPNLSRRQLLAMQP